MNNQIKIPKRIRTIAGLMFVMGLTLLGLEIRFLVGLSIPAIIFMNSLLIIASIGLWKRKEWGLFAALIACGAVISFNVVWIPMYIEVARTYITLSDIFWSIITGGPMIFAIISIVYLWRNRRCFYE